MPFHPAFQAEKRALPILFFVQLFCIFLHKAARKHTQSCPIPPMKCPYSACAPDECVFTARKNHITPCPDGKCTILTISPFFAFFCSTILPPAQFRRAASLAHAFPSCTAAAQIKSLIKPIKRRAPLLAAPRKGNIKSGAKPRLKASFCILQARPPPMPPDNYIARLILLSTPVCQAKYPAFSVKQAPASAASPP